MSSKTTNLNLTTWDIRDDMGDFIGQLNANMEIIDAAIKALQDKTASNTTSSSSTSSSS